jgi:transposase InsO family protein
LLVLGVKVAASTVWEILHDAGIDPPPERSSATWADLMRSQAEALLACDFFEAVTLSGARLYVLAAIEHASRRIRIVGATAHPTASWTVQAARNLVMDLEDADCRARFLIRDRGRKFPGLFDSVLADAAIQVVLSGVRMPRMNSIMERWVQTCRRELLDRTWSGISRTSCTPAEFEHFAVGRRQGWSGDLIGDQSAETDYGAGGRRHGEGGDGAEPATPGAPQGQPDRQPDA